MDAGRDKCPLTEQQFVVAAENFGQLMRNVGLSKFRLKQFLFFTLISWERDQDWRKKSANPESRVKRVSTIELSLNLKKLVKVEANKLRF